MKNDELFSSFEALTDLDDGILEEALAPKKPKRFPIAFAAAAAFMLIVLALAVVFAKKPDDHTVFADPTTIGTSDPEITKAPSGTENAGLPTLPPEPTGEPSPGTSPNATGGPASEPPALPTETGVPSASPGPTGGVTPGPTPGPIATPTPEPSFGPTPEPSFGPTPEPSFGPTPGPSFGPTPEPSYAPTPAPTAWASPVPTPVPTVRPSPAPTQAVTPSPTEPPSPTTPPAMPTDAPPPPVGTEATFYSEADFVSAVRNHSHQILEGIDCYYKPRTLLSGMSLLYIYVNSEIVEFVYRAANNVDWHFAWSRVYGAEYLQWFASQYPGGWHGDHYFVDPVSPSPYANLKILWAEYGVLFTSTVPASADEGDALAFCTALKTMI